MTLLTGRDEGPERVCKNAKMREESDIYMCWKHSERHIRSFTQPVYVSLRCEGGPLTIHLSETEQDKEISQKPMTTSVWIQAECYQLTKK
jgi:hypothetical protein